MLRPMLLILCTLVQNASAQEHIFGAGKLLLQEHVFGTGQLLVVDKQLRLEMKLRAQWELREEIREEMRQNFLEQHPDIIAYILNVAKLRCNLITEQKQLTELQSRKLVLAAKIQIARDFRWANTNPEKFREITRESVSAFGAQLFRDESLVVKVLNAMGKGD